MKKSSWIAFMFFFVVLLPACAIGPTPGIPSAITSATKTTTSPTLPVETIAIIPSPTSTPELPYRISYLANLSGQNQLYLLDKDLTIQPMAEDLGNVFRYEWSPDGKRIAVGVQNEEGGRGIWIIDGENIIPLILVEDPETAGMYQPFFSWSPDGNNIVCVGNDQIYIFDVNGEKQTPIPHPSVPEEIFYGQVDWSPDGKRILFSAYLQGIESEIFIVNADGSKLTRLTYNQDDDVLPTWSPNNESFFFLSRGRMDDEYVLYTMDISARNEIQLTPLMTSTNTHWSSDGSMIINTVYEHKPDREEKLCLEYLMTITQDCNITQEFTRVSDWSPDGSKWLIIKEKDGRYTLFMSNPDGSDLIQITEYVDYEISKASWVPEP